MHLCCSPTIVQTISFLKAGLQEFKFSVVWKVPELNFLQGFLLLIPHAQVLEMTCPLLIKVLETTHHWLGMHSFSSFTIFTRNSSFFSGVKSHGHNLQVRLDHGQVIFQATFMAFEIELTN